MLNIYSSNHPDLTIYVSQKIVLTPKQIEEVISVDADGTELDWIGHYFTGLPWCNARTITYYGDHAKSIVGNWNKIKPLPEPRT